MEHDIAELIRLTREMAEALDRDHLDRCTALLAERGTLLESLTTQYAPDGANLPDELRAALASVRAQDALLEARLASAMTRIGRQLGDLKAKSRHSDGGNSPVCLNKRA